MRVLDEHIDFAANLRYSLSRFAIWWILLIVTMAFDLLTTLGFVSVFGIDKEANAVARSLMHGLGVGPGVFLAKVLQLLSVTCLVALNRRMGNVFLLAVTLLNGWAIVINSH
jgi:hypothetical protein